MFGVSVGIMDGAGGAAGGDFESIATVTLGSNASNISFNSIPQTYKHLQIRGIYKDTFNASNFAVTLNMYLAGNFSTAYAWHNLSGNGTSASAVGNANANFIDLVGSGTNSFSSATDNMFGVSIIDIIDYASTTKNKTVRAFSGVDTNQGTTLSKATLTSGLFNSTSAVNQIDLYSGGTLIKAGSTFALYGIKG